MTASPLSELLSFHSSCCRLFACIICQDIVGIQLVQRQLKKLVLVTPVRLSLCVLLPLSWWWWRICDLSDQICCRRLSNTINEDTQQRNLEEHEEPNPETE